MSRHDGMPPAGVMHAALRRRDASFDGLFYAGVRTTGIVCRPSCPARKPLPRNVEFFATVREATFAGYRPCKRCRPLAVPGRHPAEVERLLDEVDADPEARLRDADLRARGLAPERIRRYFQRHFGMTFQAYSRGRRLADAFQQIRRGALLEDVTLGHGYASHSGFRGAFRRLFGAPPGRARRADCIVVGWIPSPLGPLVAASVREGICLLEFTDRRMLEGQVARLGRLFRRPAVAGRSEHLDRLRKEMERYFQGSAAPFTVPVAAPGTPFQERVWSELRRIPRGTTCSYQELARRIGAPRASRAVGRANGMNRVAIVIPCHRVVNGDGRLGGYGGGLWRKERLLALERAIPAREDSLRQLHLPQEGGEAGVGAQRLVPGL
ncbi:MAG TPA: methylated-DNA--[protein]-cysteine S-methyltransferase [Candidatus Polarisedimenticolia bacterium]|nr:methylated-DNA--[protein]-cysteine S-methyltransferase [Candidatus Polarisedimenticolia bacterium]